MIDKFVKYLTIASHEGLISRDEIERSFKRLHNLLEIEEEYLIKTSQRGLIVIHDGEELELFEQEQHDRKLEIWKEIFND